MTKKTPKQIAKLFKDSISTSSAENLPSLLKEISRYLSTQSESRRKDILKLLKGLVFEAEKTLEVELFSAQKLDRQDLKSLEQKIIQSTDAKAIEFEEIIVPELIGGIKYKYRDILFDDTLRRKIKLLKNHLTF